MNRTCLACQERTVALLLDLGPQPMSNRFPERAEDEHERHPFQFGCCRHCGLAQLIDPPPPTMVRPRVDWIRYNEPESHLDDFATRLSSLPGLRRDSRIIGLTYKEDTTIQRLTDRGYSNCYRLDPSEDWGVSDPCAGLETFQAQLTPEWTEQRPHRADLLIARHVLEHMQNPRLAVTALKQLVKPGGYLAFEVPDNTRIFSNREVCYLWEEHVTYFTPETLEATLRSLDLDVLSTHSYPYPVENALVCVAQAASTEAPAAKRPPANAAFGEATGYVAGFDADRKRVQAALAQCAAETGPIAIFGAGHLAGKFINFYGVSESIVFVADDHPRKQHRIMPGSRLPIRPGSQIADVGIRLVLLSVNPESESKVIQKYGSASVEFASLFRSSPNAFQGLTQVMTVVRPEQWRELNEAVYYTDRPVAGLDPKAISFLASAVSRTPRKRIRVCAHPDEQSRFQEMIIALGADGYVRPHRHRGKAESLHVIQGTAELVMFDAKGDMTDHVQLGPYGTAACWYYRIGEPIYHTLLPNTESFVFHESTTGPFHRDDTEFARWAPEESQDERAAAYNLALRQQLGLS